ncbi:hypothetical protein CYMTET_3056 [Cymbomonas tetramitiformis]|uniref:Uncharacterized protein n=1 Tax=Cymbomonas tetramitiformis TaxID=36881 RepID=A0AAE0H404_9CHLO|nr:hypothetical protein CYMTET_3056 [Cymbomonas tetramitiformis]
MQPSTAETLVSARRPTADTKAPEVSGMDGNTYCNAPYVLVEEEAGQSADTLPAPTAAGANKAEASSDVTGVQAASDLSDSPGSSCPTRAPHTNDARAPQEDRRTHGWPR